MQLGPFGGIIPVFLECGALMANLKVMLQTSIAVHTWKPDMKMVSATLRFANKSCMTKMD